MPSIAQSFRSKLKSIRLALYADQRRYNFNIWNKKFNSIMAGFRSRRRQQRFLSRQSDTPEYDNWTDVFHEFVIKSLKHNILVESWHPWENKLNKITKNLIQRK